jgi:transglutaminase/protease-like cytokinesis protein 3
MKALILFILFISAALHGQHSSFRQIDFKKADSIAHYYKNASLKNLPVLTHNLTHTLETDVEKFRALYTWVCANIKNDYSSYTKTVKKRKKLYKNEDALEQWNAEATPKVFKNLLKYKKTACTGYAYLMRELAGLADINCKIINGYGRTANTLLNDKSIPNHSWNAVQLNGEWYLCDPTWSAGRILLEDDGPRFEADYFDGYFLAEPTMFIKNHLPLESKWSLLSETPSLKTFIEGPVIYKEAYNSGILPTTPAQMYLEIAKNEELSFTFTSAKTIKDEKIILVINSGLSSKNVQPSIERNNKEHIIKQTFDKSGKYDVHLKIDDDLIATYVVTVKRK